MPREPKKPGEYKMNLTEEEIQRRRDFAKSINLGKTLSEETKKKISEKMKEVHKHRPPPKRKKHYKHSESFLLKQREKKKRKRRRKTGRKRIPRHPSSKKIRLLETGRVYLSLGQAAKAFGLQKKEVRAVCKNAKDHKKYGGRHTAGGWNEFGIGFHWRYVKKRPTEEEKLKAKLEQEAQKKTRKKRTTAVHCIETGITYATMKTAQEALGLGPNDHHIGDACRGIQKTAAGYHWRFAEEGEQYDCEK